jgi:RNA polymerase sigma factor (sigma-70 family)
MLQETLKHDSSDRDEIGTLKDEDLVRRVNDGEKNLYEKIIRRYNQRLYRIGLSIVNSESAIEDIMQTTYVKAYENLDKFRFESSFSTWITRILINECLMYKRARKSAESGMVVEAGSLTVVQTPLMSTINNELKIILESSIRKLPDKYRTVFIMRELESMSIAETMDCLGLTEANIKVRLNRAKVMLRDRLKDYIKDDDLLPFYKPRCNRIVDHVMNHI